MTKEEALTRIKERDFWDRLNQKEKEALQTLIPELRESEDERIRKYIVKFVELEKGVNLPPDDADEILAWLEKQKEQTEDLSTRLNGLMQEYVKSGKDEEEQEHRLKCYQLFWDALGDSEFFKQKEQKPVEWSDTDNIGWDEAFACITRAEKAAKNEEELQNAVIAEKWLKEIKFKYYVHPVKQEWSEEDEKMLNLAIEWAETMSGQFSFVDMDSTDFHKIIAWLKSLRPQPKPEWSEEDELNCNRIIRFLEPHKTFFPMKETKEEMQNWLKNRLKSLRPQPRWKPSEEQINALNALNCYGGVSYIGQQNDLISLYNDLKKLM